MIFHSILPKLKNRFSKIGEVILKGAGIILILMVIISFTDLPFTCLYWLGTHNTEISKEPDFIVLLGGSGMPSADGLLRCYFTAGAAMQVPSSKVIIALPPDSSLQEFSPELLMANELYMRGIDSSRVIFEHNGYNTHSQAESVFRNLGKEIVDTSTFRIVTSPEHMLRATKAFRKVGFSDVGGTPAFETAIDEDKLVRNKNNKLEKRALNLRYNMWSYLKYEITVTREFCALAYYKLRGWI